MNLDDISKRVYDTPIKHQEDSDTYVARPFIEGRRCYFSGKTKSEVRKKMSNYLHEMEEKKDGKQEKKDQDDIFQFDDDRSLDQIMQDTENYFKQKHPDQKVEIVTSKTGKCNRKQKKDTLDKLLLTQIPVLDTADFCYNIPEDSHVTEEYRDFCQNGNVTYNGNVNHNGLISVPFYDDRSDLIRSGGNIPKDPYLVTLNEYIEYWLLKYKKLTIEPTSYERMVMIYFYHVRDTIGIKPIGSITENDVQMLINYKANPYDGSRPLSLSGLKKIRELLKPCMERAMYDGLIPVNPCRGIYMPKERYLVSKTKKQFSLNDEQLAVFDKACRKRYAAGEYRTRDGLVLLLILNLGLRVGEALAMEWSDIDFTRKLIHINKTIQYTRAYGESVKDGTKTCSGNRVLPINPTVKELLDEMRAYDRRNLVNSRYVCCTLNGTRKNARNLQRSLDRIIKPTTLEHFSIHTLRHTFGSTLLRRGIQIEVISQLMGHSNITVTYNKYIHVLQEQKALAMENVSIT